MHESASENTVCEMVAILSMGDELKIWCTIGSVDYIVSNGFIIAETNFVKISVILVQKMLLW